MNANQIAKYLLGASILGAIFIMFGIILFRGITGEASFAEGIIGGALIPIAEQVVQFFFRKASEAEKVG